MNTSVAKNPSAFQGHVVAKGQAKFGVMSKLALAVGKTSPAKKPARPIKRRFPISNELVAELRANSKLSKAKSQVMQHVALTASAKKKAADVSTTSTSMGSIADTGWYPADCALAVGPKDVVAAVNGGVSIFDKKGALLVDRDLTEFFGAVTKGLAAFDPKAMFDPHSDRFIVVAVARDEPDGAKRRSLLLVAVSNGAQAMDGFKVYALDASEKSGASPLWADFPTLGADARGIYVGLNMFPWAKDAFGWARLLVIDKPKLLKGTVSVFNFSRLKDPDGTQSFTVSPCRTFGDPLTEYLISTQIRGQSTEKKLVLWNLEWSSAGKPSLSAKLVAVTPYRWPPAATQPDGSELATGDIRMGDAVFRSGSVYCSFTTAQEGRSAVQWVQITAATGKVLQQGVIANGTASLAYSSLQPNSVGDLALTCTATGSNLAPSIAILRRNASDALGTFGKYSVHVVGKSSQSGKDQRWGDYSAMAVDPTDSKALWAHAQTTESAQAWKTHLRKL